MEDVIRGLVYTHNRANANTAEIHETRVTLDAIVTLLVDGGALDRATLEARERDSADELRQRYIERGTAVAMQEFGISKYAFDGGAVIDCASRIPFCKASCCKLPLALSTEDVREGVVRWDLGQPYMIEHRLDGYCTHLDCATCRCTIHQHRPIPCRGYDCRDDPRIWLDFENRVVNPRIHEPTWPECLEDDRDEPAR